MALLIKAINLEFGDINNNTHLVGFSLGAHVSGFVGKELRNLSRITGDGRFGSKGDLKISQQVLTLLGPFLRATPLKFGWTRQMQTTWM